jgi:hypothetical protein
MARRTRDDRVVGPDGPKPLSAEDEAERAFIELHGCPVLVILRHDGRLAISVFGEPDVGILHVLEDICADYRAVLVNLGLVPATETTH